MSDKRKVKIEKALTEAELPLMNAVWNLGTCTVKDVQTEVAKEKELAYTSVATIMKILETKGFLKSTKSDKAHLYSPLITREEYSSQTLETIADNLFDGSRSQMVMRLLDTGKLSKKDLEDIRKELNERLS